MHSANAKGLLVGRSMDLSGIYALVLPVSHVCAGVIHGIVVHCHVIMIRMISYVHVRHVHKSHGVVGRHVVE